MARPCQPPTFNPLQPVMIVIPAGPFIMGTDPQEVRQLSRTARGSRLEWYAREQPAHTLYLPDYQIGRYPVTVAEFAVFMEADGYQRADYWSEAGWQWRTRNRVTAPEYWDDERWTGDRAFPVVGVSWYTAQAYCQWLRHETGLSYRLPSEAEWEKAARGPESNRYPWGNRWEPGFCNVASATVDSWDEPGPTTQDQLMPVGRFSPQGDSPYGCADMAGNVWEWCQSPLCRYPLSLDAPTSVDRNR